MIRRKRPGRPAVDTETVEEAFQQTIKLWRSTLLTDTPQGRTLFAHGAAFALHRLSGENWSRAACRRLAAELIEFSEAYMQSAAFQQLARLEDDGEEVENH